MPVFRPGLLSARRIRTPSPRANRVIISTVFLPWPLPELPVELKGALQMTGFGLPDGTRDLPI